MFHDDDDLEDASFYDRPVDIPTREEINAAVQIVLFLEHEMGVDVKRIRVRVRDGVVSIQGSVASYSLRREIEAVLPTRPNVKGVDLNLSIDDRF
jgi:osmotically-inducible protein OsmY